MEIKRLIIRYKEFGGLHLVREYAKLGLVLPIISAFFECIVHRKSFKSIYRPVLAKVEPMLVSQYDEFLIKSVEDYKRLDAPRGHSSKIWFCWLQGKEAMPDIVRACWNSLHRHLTDMDIIFIDNENWKEYVQLPDYVTKKWRAGRIPMALFSDMLRLELLINHGGTWIDSTVLCTGRNQVALLDADLFMFQYTKPGSDVFGGISNWFISSVTNHPLLMALRDVLYAYWHDYDCTIDYYIFHLFFSRIQKQYPDIVAQMPYAYSPNSLVLMMHWADPYDEVKFGKLCEKVSFHKLSNRPSKKVLEGMVNYYKEILKINKIRNNDGYI